MTGVNTETGEKVAIKMQRPTQQCSFKNEVELMKKLNHRHITKLIDHGQTNYRTINRDDETIDTYPVEFIALEKCDGGELFDFCELGPFPEEMARNFIKQALRAIDHMHGLGMAHRDIKLENILLDENYHVRLGDFGLGVDLQ